MDIFIVLDDYPDVKKPTEVTIIVENPCLKSLFDPLADLNMENTIFDPPVSDNLVPTQDTSSRINGGDGLTHCGDRIFTL